MPLYHSRSGRAFNVTGIRPHDRNEKHLSETSAAFKLKAMPSRCYKQATHLRRQKPSEQGSDMRFKGSPCLHKECWHTHSLQAIQTKKKIPSTAHSCVRAPVQHEMSLSRRQSHSGEERRHGVPGARQTGGAWGSLSQLLMLCTKQY